MRFRPSANVCEGRPLQHRLAIVCDRPHRTWTEAWPQMLATAIQVGVEARPEMIPRNVNRREDTVTQGIGRASCREARAPAILTLDFEKIVLSGSSKDEGKADGERRTDR